VGSNPTWRAKYRGIAQSGRAPALGAGSREFESLYPDQSKKETQKCVSPFLFPLDNYINCVIIVAMYTDQLKEDIDTILDVFGGADGGVGFAMFNAGVKDIAKRLEDGTLPSEQVMAAIKVLNTIAEFRRILDITGKRMKS
jgi:hypothetical protein